MTFPRAVSLDLRDRHAVQEQEHTSGHAALGPHPHGAEPASAGDGLIIGAASPLWWSAPQRLACAAVLVALLWLVIAWATA